VYALLLETDSEPDTLPARLDEPLPHELDAEQARRLELQRDARENRDALNLLGGLKR
jgi:hypothetical protein